MKKIYAGLVIMFIMLSATAQAAPFCIAGMGMPLQCIYDDIKVCRMAISSPQHNCIANPDAVLSYSGGARYCRVTSYLSAECIFTDRAQCRKEASLHDNICLDRMSMKDENNPYRFDDRIQE